LNVEFRLEGYETHLIFKFSILINSIINLFKFGLLKHTLFKFLEYKFIMLIFNKALVVIHISIENYILLVSKG